MIKHQFKKLIEIAKALSPINRTDVRNHHVTFMLKKRKIVAIGVNNAKTNTKNLKYNYTNKDNKCVRTSVNTHSELASVIKYGKENCSDITFINIRIDRNGNLNNSSPCKGCTSLLKQVGFKKLFYTTQQQTFEELKI